VTALDGLQTLTVGGIAVVTNGVAAGFPQSVVSPLGSTFTITGYNPATGVVSYSYTLVDNETRRRSGANSLTENFNVVATDTTAAPPAARSTSTSSMTCRPPRPTPARWWRAVRSMSACWQ
jgi:hypothetical protein